MKKRFIAFMLCMAMVFSMTACGGSGSEEKQDAGDNTETDDSGSDVDYIKEKGTLVVGITEFEPHIVTHWPCLPHVSNLGAPSITSV